MADIINVNILDTNLLNNDYSLHQLYSFKDKVYKYKMENNVNESKKTLINNIDKHLDFKINKIQHEKTKILTIISTIFLPLGFIVGFFGMNFKSMGVPSLKNGIFTIHHSEKFVFILSLICIIIVLIFFHYIEYHKKY
jgi:Mg2+ and Co2+ transporter CorA